MDPVELIEMLQGLLKAPYILVAGASKDRIVYLSSEGGVYNRLYSYDPSSGKSLRLTEETAFAVANPRRTSNDVFYAKDTAKGAEHHKVYRTDAASGGERLFADVEETRIGGLASYAGTASFSGSTKEDTSLYLARGGMVEKLEKLPPACFLTDANDRYMAGFGTLAGNPRSFELFFYDIAKGKLATFTPKAGSVNQGPALMGSKALFESDASGSKRFHVHDIETGETTPAPAGHADLEAYAPGEFSSFDWTEDGKVMCVALKEGESRAFVDGMAVETPPGTVFGLALFGGRCYLSHSTFSQPFRVLEADMKGGAARVVIDNQLPQSLRERFGSASFVKIKASDGLEIPTLVALAPGGGKRRTVTYIHGGPWGEVDNVWGVLENSLVAAGYNVVAPNFRGSTGYGDEFRMKDIGDPGGADFGDMVSAAKWALENVATEVALVGYSYGGFSTLLGLGKEPELWACGVAGAPVADWKEMRDLGDAAFRGFIDMLFDGKQELLADRSPIKYARNVKRPLCIIACQNDSRTPMLPVLRYAIALQENGAKFELHSVPDMGHSVRTVKDVMDIEVPTISFLQKEFPPTPR